MKVRLWGVRGSTPAPERGNGRYGGNTACVELRLDNNTLFIFDCGSGLRALGNSLISEFAGRPIQAHIFLTHFHWDHIQGIPSFVPFYKKDNTFFFYSPLCPAAQLRQTIEGMMGSPHFPVAMAARRRFFHLGKTPLNINGALISGRGSIIPRDAPATGSKQTAACLPWRRTPSPAHPSTIARSVPWPRMLTCCCMTPSTRLNNPRTKRKGGGTAHGGRASASPGNMV